MTTFKNLSFLILLFVISLSTYAQTKLFTLDEISSGKSYLLYPQYVRAFQDMMQLQWMKGLDAYTYVKADALYQGLAKDKTTDKVLIDLVGLNKNFVKAGYKELKSFPEITWINESSFWFIQDEQILVYDMKKGGVTVGNCCKADAKNADIEPSTLNIAYTIDNNLYVSIQPEGAYQVTKDADKNIVNGQVVSRHEFGIEKGTFWSPKGTYLAFYKKDESNVGSYPILDINKPIATVDFIKYPMAGTKSEIVSLGIFDVKNKKTIWLKTEANSEQYLTNITWTPDEKYVIIAVLNRDQNYLKLNQYNPITGELVKTLFEEKNSKFIEPESGPIFFKTRPDDFLWFSKKSGYKQLYHYNLEGELIEQLTEGKSDIISFVGFDATEQNVIYLAVDEEYALSQNVYSINLTSKEIVSLSNADGVHSVLLSSTGKFILDIYSSAKIPNEIALMNVSGLPVKKVYTGNNPLSEYKLGETVLGTLKAEDGTDLYYRMIKPIDFDETKKYPVIVYVYGGPHLQLITNSWLNGASLWMHYMAQQGYVVFTLDNRGTPNRSLKFEQAIFRNLGELEVKDQMTGVDFLKKQSFVDPARIGVHGWSYGGYMTTTLMLKQPETFKVGVAGAPVIDWANYEIMYGERYMDTPQDNPEGYKNTNLLNFVKGLQGKLLIIHGTSDDTVVLQHTLKFIEECNKKNVMVEYYLYPGQKHSVGGPDRINLNYRITNYFKNNL